MTLLSDLKIWSALKRFKDFCHHKGWKAGDDGSWFKVGSEYHIFVWSRAISPSTFRTIVEHCNFSVREGDHWDVHEARYVAFVTTSDLSQGILSYIQHHPEVLSRTVLYDLNQQRKLRVVESPVYDEFERFLEKEYGLNLNPFGWFSRKNIFKIFS